jgi:pimeloyl-ACP methyl ester carboxylesterase
LDVRTTNEVLVTKLLRTLAGVLACCGLLVAPSAAQSVRYELGMRLRALERDWAEASADDKARALPELRSAVDQFFRLRLSTAARGLDRARFTLSESADEGMRWAAQWSVHPEWSLGETREEPAELRVTLDSLYRVELPAPEGARALLRLVTEGGRELARAELPLPCVEAPCSTALQLEGLPSGDHRLIVDFGTSERVWITRELGVSLARGTAARVMAARKALEAGIAAPSLERSTASRLLELLERLIAGEALETDYPAARLLHEVEQLVHSESGRAFYDSSAPGEFWLRVPVGSREVDLRIAAPASGSGELRPCVVALHGAGGSDNLYFDGYGDGAAVRLATERGWVLIAPRAPFFGPVDVVGILDVLSDRYALDRTRCVVIGHSMGAAQALGVAADAPDAVAALALIGGGRPSRKDAECVQIPTYIAAGSEDFGLSGARALHESLVKLGGRPRLDVRRGIEHLTIVQEVLPTAFAFFDIVSARKDRAGRPR